MCYRNGCQAADESDSNELAVARLNRIQSGRGLTERLPLSGVQGEPLNECVQSELVPETARGVLISE